MKLFILYCMLQKAIKVLKAALESLYGELCRDANSPTEVTPGTLVPFEHDFTKKKKEVGFSYHSGCPMIEKISS